MIKFTIIGKPKQQQRHRPSARGGYYDPSSKDKKQIWLQIAKFKPKQPFVGDITLTIRFTMPIPKSWYRTSKYKHLLKDKFKGIKYHSVKPDLDNLVKLIADCIGNKTFIVAEAGANHDRYKAQAFRLIDEAVNLSRFSKSKDVT